MRAAKVPLHDSVKQQLDQLCEKLAMTDVHVVSKLVKWFGQQDERVQSLILGLLAESEANEAAFLVLEKMAASKRLDGSVS